MSVKIIPYLIMSFGLWIMYWLFTLWFRIPFYEPALRLWQGIRNFCFLHRSFSQHSSTKPVKATEILMVIATPSILSGFTWPLSQMPVWVQAISM
jgi:ABC-2 type transport system permease protein